MTIELEGSSDCLASSIGDYILTLCATIIGGCSALVISDSAVFSTGHRINGIPHLTLPRSKLYLAGCLLVVMTIQRPSCAVMVSAVEA